jgi:protein-tyrosine-phosphatase
VWHNHAMEDPGLQDKAREECSNQASTRKRLQQLAKNTLKRRLPDRLLSEIRAYRKNPREERATYLRLRLSEGAGFRGMGRMRVPSTSRSLLFVCFGNIMRSPMCEALVRQALAEQQRSDVTVTSAGLHATPGGQAHPWAISAASKMGVDLSHHEARLLTAEMMEAADAVFAMDCRNVVELVTRFPAARNKIYMLGAYAETGHKSVEIKDPFHGDEEATRQCYECLAICIAHLVASLGKPVES